MAQYADAVYRVGYQGYLAYLAETAKVLTPASEADPSEQTCTSVAGYIEKPQHQTTEGLQEIDAVGEMRTVTTVVGRRESSVGTRVLVADGTFLEYAVRDHATPTGAGTVHGLPLLALEYGAATDWGYGYARQGIDCLFNGLRLQYAENQPVVATVDVWPECVIEATGQAASTPTAAILHWCHCSWTIGGTDYYPIMAGYTLNIANGLQRVGMRKQFGAVGSELAISRTPLKIQPTLEKLQTQLRLRDKLPAELKGTDDWGVLTVRAEEPGSGAGRQYLEISIDHNLLNNNVGEQAPAGQLLMWSVTPLSYVITIDAGVTAS
ncbi:MAG: hypothetical protein U9R79_06195 [Armatimonadota bacterium]|nr:hypothetical protein [Armatimonadota bacterium]